LFRSLITHVLYFHYRKPVNRWRVVVRIAGIVFILYSVLFFLTPFSNLFSLLQDTMAAKIAAYVNSTVLYVFLFFSYAQVYFLIDRSISARILTDIMEAGGTVPREYVRERYSPDALQQRRLDDMVYGGYIAKQDGTYLLTAKGRSHALAFRWCKKYLHLYPGG
ncbi:MAG: hypothetical protein G01um101470_999, partial [Parcubacteria group bacterium Gr01-1014_70]